MLGRESYTQEEIDTARECLGRILGDRRLPNAAKTKKFEAVSSNPTAMPLAEFAGYAERSENSCESWSCP